MKVFYNLVNAFRYFFLYGFFLLPLNSLAQGFFRRLVHPFSGNTANEQITDPQFSDQVVKRIKYFDKSSNDVKFQKSPDYANQPPSYRKDSLGVEQKSSNDPSSNDLNCTTKLIRITAQSTSFMNASYAEQAQHIYPGAIYELKNFMNGSFKEINADRNPITLSSDNPNMTSASYINVEAPSIVSLRDGVKNLYNGFNDTNIGTMNLRYQTYDYQNISDLTLKLSGGIGFASFSSESEFKITKNSNHHYITIDVVKPMFTINAVKNGSTYFSENVDNVKNPVVISSVTYGIRVLANVDIITKNEKEYIDFKARYSGLISRGNIDFEYIKGSNLSEQTINCYIVGGSGRSSISVKPEQLEQAIEQLIATVTYATSRPISYTLSDLQGNVIGVESATDVIKERDCSPVTTPKKITSALISWKTGDDNKNKETKYTLSIYQKQKNYPAPSSIICDNSNNSAFSNKEDLVAWYNDCNNIEYEDGKDAPSISLNISSAVVSNGLKDGGVLQLHMESPNDTWKIASLILTLRFDDGSSQIVTSSGFEVGTFKQEFNLFIDDKSTQKK